MYFYTLKILAGLTAFLWLGNFLTYLLARVKNRKLVDILFYLNLGPLPYLYLGVYYSWIVLIPLIIVFSYMPVWQWYFGLGATLIDYLRALVWDNFQSHRKGTNKMKFTWKLSWLSLTIWLFLIWFLIQ